MAVFDYAVRYAVMCRCVSPLRTGGANGEIKEILRDIDGRPMIQGSSIAGVFRALTEQKDPAEASRIFGAKKDEDSGTRSLVTVSDAVFDKAAKTVERPRVRIDRHTGAGADGQKFSVTGVEAGAEFSFTMLLKTTGYDEEAEKALETALAALDAGEATFGGQFSNGFGIVRVTSVKKRALDLTTPEGREGWMKDAEPEQECKLSEYQPNTICLTISGTTDHFLIRDGNSEKIKDDSVNSRKSDKTYSTAMKSGSRYVLPGSALKGVLRSRTEWIASVKGVPGHAAQLFGREPDPKIEGDHGVAGSVRVREFIMQPSASHAIISRTKIDRITGGAKDKHLFSEEVVSGAVTVSVSLPQNVDPADCALLFYAMRDLAAGRCSFGGEGGIGRGALNTGAVLTVTQGSDSCSFTNGIRTSDKGTDGFIRKWLEALDHVGQSDTEV